MNTWLCVTNRENFRVIKGKGIWGVSERHSDLIINDVKQGDYCIFYLKEEGSYSDRHKAGIGGAFRVTSPVFKDYTDVFPFKSNDTEQYPYRVRIECIKTFDPELPFKSLIADLTFIKKKHNYGSYIFGRAMKKLNDVDTDIIFNYLYLNAGSDIDND